MPGSSKSTTSPVRTAKDQIEAFDDRGRRWHQVRPQPRRRSDLMGFNSTLWMALGWLIVIVLIVFPFPWWW
jgi:hypothetical protein